MYIYELFPGKRFNGNRKGRKVVFFLGGRRPGQVWYLTINWHELAPKTTFLEFGSGRLVFVGAIEPRGLKPPRMIALTTE